MNLEVTQQALFAKPEYKQAFRSMNHLDTVSVEVEQMLSASSKFPSEKNLAFKTPYALQVSKTQALAENSSSAKVEFTSHFVDNASELLALFSSLATRFYMMADYRGEKSGTVSVWELFSEDVARLQIELDFIKITNDKFTQDKAILMLRKLYKQLRETAPINFRVRIQLGLTDSLFSELNSLMEACEASAFEKSS